MNKIEIFATYRSGILFGLGLIGAIGAQNIFVIKEGMKGGRNGWIAAGVCSLCDVLLILLGVSVTSQLMGQYPQLKPLLVLGGVLFLLVYASRAFGSALSLSALEKQVQSMKTDAMAGKVVGPAIAFSLLNPHAFLDTAVLIGGAASAFSGADKTAFVGGTVTASFLWFFGLVCVTVTASPYLKSVRVWRGVEILSGSVMIIFALRLGSGLM